MTHRKTDWIDIKIENCSGISKIRIVDFGIEIPAETIVIELKT